MLTQEELKKELKYEPETGKFKWIAFGNGKKEKVGSKHCRSGYVRINIKRESYLAHQLAWLYVYGEWPENMVDHINGDTSDNRIENLRISNNRKNQQNRHTHRVGRLVGASYSKRFKKWSAGIRVNNKRTHLGYFDSEQEAHDVYMKAVNELYTNGKITNSYKPAKIINKQPKKTAEKRLIKGCSFNKRDKKWRAYIFVNKKQKSLGYFDTEEEAHTAYLNSIRKEEEK